MQLYLKVGILGYGEIGQSISKFYDSPKIKDLHQEGNLKDVDILHICIPWSRNFVKIITKEIKEIMPKLVIIHSTVKIGTTDKIISSLSRGCRMIVHSPIRGQHPNLFESLKTFVKYIGADNKKAGKMAKEHLESLGIKTKLFTSSMTTEALKLWDTTQYGWFIILNKEIKKWCEKKGLDFDIIYTEANKSYNEGYQKLGRPEVIRPCLQYILGKIGRHCVIPNCELLDSEIAKYILKKNTSIL